MTLIKGVTIGFILGVLFAPDKGSATRRKFARTIGDIRDDIEATCSDIGETVKNFLSDIKHNADETAGNAKNEFSKSERDLGDTEINGEERL